MIILILINIAIIIYIYLKYYKFPKIINEDNIKDKESIIIGYINDRSFNNNFDLILAQIIELNIKGYITIQYSDDKIDKYNYTIIQNIDIELDKINKYEMVVLNYLFSNKMEITKKELEEKINNTFASYNTRFNEIEKILNEKLLEDKIIDGVKQKKLSKNRKRYIQISIILIILLCGLRISESVNISSLYMLIYILEKVISSILLLKVSTYTEKGQILKYNIDDYKMKLKNQEFFTNKATMKDVVLKKEFANSIALHINTQAKELFLDDKTLKNATRISKKTLINILIGILVFILLTLIISKIIALLPIWCRVWIYIIVAISVAFTADVTLYKKK